MLIFYFLFFLIVIICLFFLSTAFYQLFVISETSFFFLNSDNYDEFTRIVQAISLFTIPIALFIENIRQTKEKDKIKIERTLNYLNTWREGNLYKHYIEIQNILTDICENPKFSGVFDENKKHVIIQECIDEYKKILNDYFKDEKNKEKQHSFSRIRSFFYEIMILINQDYLDRELLNKIFFSETQYIWRSCYLYYEDSRIYGEIVKQIQDNLFKRKDKQ